MNSTEPRLNKLPFVVADACCLLAAALLGFYAKAPITGWPLISCALLVIVGGVVVVYPWVVDNAADTREASARLRDELELQIKRVQAAAESLGRAAAQIKTIEEAVQKSARDAETLPYRMQEKLAEFNEALAAKENDEREALERELEELRAGSSDQLKAVAEKIAKATIDWAALETATRRQLSAAQDVSSRLDEKLKGSMAQLENRISDLAHVLAAAPAPRHPLPAAGPEPAPAPAHVVEAVTVHAASSAPVAAPESPPAEAPKARKPRPPRKMRPEDTLAAMSEPSASSESGPPPVATTGEDAPSATSPEASVSSDGATRLLATAYIGIGNRLFIRGDGPGLSWDKGVPMQFVSIGKWGWSTHDAAAPVSVKLYKNDETAALSGGLTIEPGRHTEVTALF